MKSGDSVVVMTDPFNPNTYEGTGILVKEAEYHGEVRPRKNLELWEIEMDDTGVSCERWVHPSNIIKEEITIQDVENLNGC
jgi:hypothetical protein